jgi:hypothetical protein
MNRRDFIKLAAAGTGASLAGSPLVSGQTPPAAPPPGKTMVAMPISIAILAGPDLDRVLGDMKDRGGVTALFPFMYSHEEHRAGVPERSPGFRGGNYATPHLQYYGDSPLTYADMKAPEFGGIDVLARVIPAAAKHGIKVFPFVLEDNHCPADMPHWEQMYEIDVHGRRVGGHPAGPCKRNPQYRAWLGGVVEDYARSYDIGGMMWGAERGSGFLNVLSGEGAGTRGTAGGGKATCFCEFCQKAGREAGIDVTRAKAGFIELEKFMQERRAGRRPNDGYFSGFWRLLLNYPELVAWENLWVRGRHELQAELHRRMKAANPALPMGWHIWQTVTFSPFQRAEEDYAVIKGFSDFVRPAVYNNCAGERFQAFARSGLGGVFGDLSPALTAEVICREMGFSEAPYDRLAATGFSAGYVERETRRAVEGVSDAGVQVWPGIDIDIPVPAGTSHCTPEGVKAAVRAVFSGGANGIILSRNYVEMKPENLSAAGDALRELGRA